MKTYWTRGSVSLAALLALSACQEPQPAPDLLDRPVADFKLETIVDGLPSPWAALLCQMAIIWSPENWVSSGG